MADTYTSLATVVGYGVGKSLWSLFNGTGSGKVLRVYRIWALNNAYSPNLYMTIQGFLTNLGVMRITSQAFGIDTILSKHDSNNADLDSNIGHKVGAKVTDSTLLRQIVVSNEDPGVGGASYDEWCLCVPVNTIWEVGYANSNGNKALTLREGEGVSIKHLGASPTGSVCDVFAEFTQSAS